MLKNYLFVAFRVLNKNRTYGLINILGLAIGIACFLLTSIYVKDQLNYDRFHEHAGDVYRITITRTFEATDGNDAKWSISHVPLSPLMDETYPSIINHGRITRFATGGSTLQYENKVFTEQDIFYVDASIPAMFGYQSIQGNIKSALEKINGAVITRAMAGRIFGSDDPIGKVIKVADLNLEVGAVLEDYDHRSHFGFKILVSYPTYLAIRGEDSEINDWRWSQCWNYLQLAENTDPYDIENDFSQFTESYIPQWTKGKDRVLDLQPLPEIHLKSDVAYEIQANGNIQYVMMTGAIGVFILILAIINYMNLATARSMKRSKEVGVRKIMGSRRSSLVIQFITESMLVVALSVVIAVFLVEIFAPIFSKAIGIQLLFTPFDPEIIITLIALLIFIGIASGIYPAIFLSGFPALLSIKGSGGSNSELFRKGLVIFQFLITTVLLLSTLVINDQLRHMLQQDLGFDKEKVLVLHDNIDQEVILSKLELLCNRLEDLPGINAVSYSSSLPTGNIYENAVHYESNGEMETSVFKTLWTDHKYLKTMGLKLISGRGFSDLIQSDQGQSFIVNEALVKEMNWENPLGKRMKHGRNPDQTFRFDGTVIGVVENFSLGSAHQSIQPLVIMMGAEPWGHLTARISTNNMSQVLKQIDETWQLLLPSVPLEMSFLDNHFNQQYHAETNILKLISGLSLISIFIACLGLFGLASYLAEQRTKEIGIRKVIGASVKQLIMLLSRDFLILIGVAFLMGSLVGYIFLDNWLNQFVYRINVGGLAILLTGLSILLIGFVSVGAKAYRAAMANPIKALKYE